MFKFFSFDKNVLKNKNFIIVTRYVFSFFLIKSAFRITFPKLEAPKPENAWHWKNFSDLGTFGSPKVIMKADLMKNYT